MKTKMTRLNQIVVAAFLILFLMSVNVDAKETQMIAASGLENIAEPKLEIENWMINETYWVSAQETNTFQKEQEENLLLEDWMVNDKKWGLSLFEYPGLDSEPKLVLENWMLSGIYWN
jgi:hypothetical protein